MRTSAGASARVVQGREEYPSSEGSVEASSGGRMRGSAESPQRARVAVSAGHSLPVEMF